MDDLKIIMPDFQIDFVKDKLNYAKKKSGLKTELLSRAVGAGRLGVRILDLSAGLAIDSIFLAQMGYEVTAVERNDVIFKKLEAAWMQLDDQLKKHIRFVHAEAIDYLKLNEQGFDVIYFDPMFPEKKKSALPRKEMVIFRSLVGSDEDAAEVLEKAISYSSVKRIVVKRPVKAPCLFKKPQHQLFGKLIRFDIYGAQK